MPSKLLAGAGSRVITPNTGCLLAGFDARKGVASGVHDDLHSRALVLDDGKTQIAFISVEVIGLDRKFADRSRREIEQRTGIPARHVILACTHTHCGPVTFNHFFNQGQPLDQVYLEFLLSGIVGSVEDAFSDRREREVRTGLLPVSNIAVNRRTATGQPVDPLAGVISIEDPSGNPTAVLVNYACHPTVLGPDTLEITADFPYFTIRRLKETLGDRTEVLFVNGAEGDISVGHRSDLSAIGVIAPFRTFARAEELGKRLAHAILDGLPTLSSEQTCLSIASREVQLPLKRYAPLKEMSRLRNRALDHLREVEARTEKSEEELLIAKRQGLFSRIEEYYASLYEQSNDAQQGLLSAEMTVARVGETAILALPGEVFVEIGLRIRSNSPFRNTIFAGLANDYIGYVPTAAANAELGYEVVASRVTPDAEIILVSAATDLLHTAYALSATEEREVLH